LKKLDFLYGGKPFATGDHVRLVDFTVYELLNWVQALHEETFKSYPNLVAAHAAFTSLPEIKVH
jgi:glutathione S-transferase